jgi:hypothetical protein
MTGTGLKKCAPMNLSGLSVAAAIAVTLKLDVLLKIKASGFTIPFSS